MRSSGTFCRVVHAMGKGRPEVKKESFRLRKVRRLAGSF